MVVGIPLLLLIAFEVYYNFIYDQNELNNKILAEIDKVVVGSVAYRDIDITFTKRFNHARLTVRDLMVYDEIDTILKVGMVSADVSVRKIVNGNYAMNDLQINEAFFKNHVREDSTRSTLKFKKGNNPTGAQIEIPSYNIKITNSRVRIVNEFKEQNYDIEVKAAQLNILADPDTLVISGTAHGEVDPRGGTGLVYLNNHDLIVQNALVKISKNDGSIIFENGNVDVDETPLTVKGSISKLEVGNQIDLQFEAEDTKLNSLIGFIPDGVQHELTQVNKEASVMLKMAIHGYSDMVKKPQTDVSFVVKDASLQNGEHPELIKDIHFSGSYTNGIGRAPETSELHIIAAQAQLGDSYIRSDFSIVNFNDPHVSTNIKAHMKMRDISDYVNLPDIIQAMDGAVTIDMDFAGKLSDFREGFNTNEKYHGYVNLEGVRLALHDMPIVFHDIHGKIEVSNQEIAFNNLIGYYHGSEFKLDGTIKHYAPILMDIEGEVIDSDLNLRLGRFELASRQDSTNGKIPVLPVFVNARVGLTLDTLIYEDLMIQNLNTSMFYANHNYQIDLMNFNVFGGHVALNGSLHNSTGDMTGLLNIQSKFEKLKWPIKALDPDDENPKKETNHQIDFELELVVDDFIYDSMSYNIKSADIKSSKDIYTVNHLHLTNEIGIFKITRPFDINLKEKKATGAVNVVVNFLELDKYLSDGEVPSETNSTFDSPIIEWWDLSSLNIYLNAKHVLYKKNNFYNNKVDVHMTENRGNVHFSNNAYSGAFSGDIRVLHNGEHFYGELLLNGKNIDVKTFLSQNDNFDQDLLSEEHVIGEIDFNSQIDLTFDPIKRDFEVTSGLVDLTDVDIQLIEFDPITQAMKFIKQEYLDTLGVAASDLYFYFDTNEIIVPPTVIKTTESNFLIFGRYEESGQLEMDIMISLSDMFLRGRNKKAEMFENAEMTSLGGLNYRLSLSGPTEELHSSHLKKREFEQRKRAIELEKKLIKKEIKEDHKSVQSF